MRAILVTAAAVLGMLLMLTACTPSQVTASCSTPNPTKLNSRATVTLHNTSSYTEKVEAVSVMMRIVKVIKYRQVNTKPQITLQPGETKTFRVREYSRSSIADARGTQQLLQGKTKKYPRKIIFGGLPYVTGCTISGTTQVQVG
jgi:hypothetical protein